MTGGPKPKSIEQPFLIGIVVDFVQKMLPSFAGSDILYIRSMRASKMAVLNVQCRSVVKAGLVKSTFATLVKQTVKPDYIGNVSFVTYFLMQYSYVHLSVANWTHFCLIQASHNTHMFICVF